MHTFAALLVLAFQDAKPQFEVASVKPSAPDARNSSIRAPNGRVTITNMPLKEMMVFAWRVQRYQISGGPPWMASERYDVSAKAEGTPTQGQLQLMFQAMLADRFQLATHFESKDLPIYALVLARKDGKLGPKLTESKQGGCTTFDPTQPRPQPAPGQPLTLYCGQQMTSMQTMTGVSVPLANIVPGLARLLGRMVVDKTGLTGKYDISLEWAPDEAQMAMLPPDVPRPAASDTPRPSIFTALQEQLGLKLESQKGPVEVLVVDRVERPTGN